MLVSDGPVFIEGALEVVLGAVAVEAVPVVAVGPVVPVFEVLPVVTVAVPLVAELPGISTQI